LLSIPGSFQAFTPSNQTPGPLLKLAILKDKKENVQSIACTLSECKDEKLIKIDGGKKQDCATRQT
jgi:hypothetical protein